MTYLVPFDGSQLSTAALARADEFRTAGLGVEEILVVAVVPDGNVRYARRQGWLDDDEPFDAELVSERLREQARAVTPSFSFRMETVGKRAKPGDIAGRVRSVARSEDVAMVFVGSENAGRMVTSVSSVGGSVAHEAGYDVVIVRRAGE